LIIVRLHRQAKVQVLWGNDDDRARFPHIGQIAMFQVRIVQMVGVLFPNAIGSLGMKSWHKVAFALTSFGALLASLAEAGDTNDAHTASLPIAAGNVTARGLSVLTYNIHGMPWPFATDRLGAFEQIEDRLIRMRGIGTQPRIIVLQEAFTDRAREIGANSGYRFVVDGPSRDQIGSNPQSERETKFAAATSFIKGETIGKWLGSGLQILSDYPILSVRRAAFPSFACAGYDCLANKGALLVTVRVPGQAQPVTIVTTHMNSKRASGVSEARSSLAYQLQAAALERFVQANHDLASPIIFAGDFNASNLNRRQILAQETVAPLLSGNRNRMKNGLAEITGRVHAWPPGLKAEVDTIATRGRDWQFFASGIKAALAPHSISVPFGRDADGTMLSDHMGLTISYDLQSKG
jgi:endonuclease/exonuclease/phosphatase family metal-dependent hydrolase